MLWTAESRETDEYVTSRAGGHSRPTRTTRRRLLALTWLAALALAGSARAAEEAAPDQGTVRYVELKPTFVTNYGYSEVGRLKYVKADISVRVHSVDAEFAIRNHLPQIRHQIVLLLSRQDEEGLTTKTGRERLRSLALDSIREILDTEEGGLIIDELLFTRFIVQR